MTFYGEPEPLIMSAQRVAPASCSEESLLLYSRRQEICMVKRGQGRVGSLSLTISQDGVCRHGILPSISRLCYLVTWTWQGS